MNLWTWTEKVIPAKFSLEEDKTGAVYIAESKGPPLQIKRIDPSHISNNKQIAVIVEYEDCLGVGTNSVLSVLGFGVAKLVDTTSRLALHPSDARFLAFSLLKALAEGGDLVAFGLLQKIPEIMQNVKDENDKKDEDDDCFSLDDFYYDGILASLKG